MTRRWTSGLVVLALLTVSAAPPLPLSPDHVALQGTWVLKETEWLDEKCDLDASHRDERILRSPWPRLPERWSLPRRIPRHPTTLSFRRDTFVWKFWKEVDDAPGWYEVAIPGRYELVVHDGRKIMKRYGPNGENPPLYGLYAVDGNTLRWCVTDEGDLKSLPKTIATSTDDSVMVLTFRRQRRGTP